MGWWCTAYLRLRGQKQAEAKREFPPHSSRSIYVIIFIYWVHPIYLYRYLCIGWDTGLLHTLAGRTKEGVPSALLKIRCASPLTSFTSICLFIYLNIYVSIGWDGGASRTLVDRGRQEQYIYTYTYTYIYIYIYILGQPHL